jgi:triacylglycerol esterase/lipase EstA (alpha/beta hydrolase family)
MLARALRVGLLLSLAFALLCAQLLAGGTRGTWLEWLATFLAAFVALPLVLTVASFVVAAWYRAPAPPSARVGLVRYLQGVVVETFWFTALYWFMQAFPRFVLKPENDQRAGTQVPVLLVHGFTCNAAVWAWLAPELRRRGYAVFTVNLEPIHAPIDSYAAAVAAAVERLSAATGGGKVAIVGHSMGGLVARAYLRKSGGRSVATLVTLGTPHHGTALAPFGFGRNAFEMRRTSAWLGGLRAFEEGGWPAPVTSIYSYHDNLVAPQTSSELAGATNVPLGGLGHMTLLFSPRVANAVAAALAQADQRDQR